MGTATWVGNTVSLIELPNSPQLEIAEKWTRTKSYRGSYALCLSSALPRGTVGTGDDAGYIVARSVVTKERGGIGMLVVTWEAGGATSGAELPPIKYSCAPEKLPRALKYNPRYASLTTAQLDAIDKALESESVSGNSWYNSFAGTALALELYQKRKRGQDTYYLSGLKYSYTFASWTIPSLTLGGFLDTPDGPMSGLLPASSSWLRLADDHSYSGAGYYETTRTWIGSPAGDWDTDLY